MLLLVACHRTPEHLAVEDDLGDETWGLLDADSAAVTFPTAYGGRPTLVSAIYTHCPDVCPMTMANVERVRDLLGADTTRVQFVTVSFDPARDTPAVLRSDARAWGIGRGWSLLTGDTTTVAGLMDRLGIRTERGERDTLSTGEVTYDVSHSDKLLLLDPQGRIVETYGGSAAPPEMVAADVRALF